MKSETTILFIILIICWVNFTGAADTYRINCGGGNYVDQLGRTWLSDQGFYNTGPSSFIPDPVGNTQDDPLYQTRRYSDNTAVAFTYTFSNVDLGSYYCSLHFAEMWNGAYSNGIRKFNILINGIFVYGPMDIYAEAGASNALIKTFGCSPDGSGRISIVLDRIAQNPIIAAIEIVKTGSPPTPSPSPAPTASSSSSSPPLPSPLPSLTPPPPGRCTNVIGEWFSGVSAPAAHVEGATAVVNNKLYVITGFATDDLVPSSRVDIYNVASDSWSTGAPAPIQASHIQSAAWTNPPIGPARYIFIAGGFVGPHPGNPTAQVWRYDTIDNKWDAMPNLPAPRASGGVVVDKNHQLHYICGLINRNDDSADHWVLDLLNTTAGWKNKAQMPNKRNHFQAKSIGSYIYALGGQTGHDAAPFDVNYLHRYNVDTDQWEQRANLPGPRSHVEPATVVINDRLVLFGGRNNRGENVLKTVIQYDPTENMWTFLRDLPERRIGPAGGFFFKNITVKGVVGDFVVITNGGLDYNMGRTTTWIAKVDYQCI